MNSYEERLEERRERLEAAAARARAESEGRFREGMRMGRTMQGEGGRLAAPAQQRGPARGAGSAGGVVNAETRLTLAAGLLLERVRPEEPDPKDLAAVRSSYTERTARTERRARRFILLPNGERVTLRVYVEAWQTLKHQDPRAVVGDWDYFRREAREVLRDMRRGMHERINRHLPWWTRGRKWRRSWQFEAHRFACKVNTPRLIIRVRECPPEWRERFATRLYTDEELAS